jgi:hypothetical protein
MILPFEFEAEAKNRREPVPGPDLAWLNNQPQPQDKTTASAVTPPCSPGSHSFVAANEARDVPRRASQRPLRSTVIDFYDGLAEEYHLVYADHWDDALRHQATRSTF